MRKLRILRPFVQKRRLNYESATEVPHIPVMVEEVTRALLDSEPKPKVFVDMTFGAGGHTRHIVRHSTLPLTVYALDRDPIAIEHAKKMRLELEASSSGSRVVPLHGLFSDLVQLLEAHDQQPNTVDACLIDCGASSMQFNDPDRGFALAVDGPLDMRMNQRVDACLIDCGASSMQFNDPDRGFALAVDGPLDMRMNQRYICTHVWAKYRRVDACLIDCGASSMRFDDPDGGLALAVDGPLDMRMNQRYICTHVWAKYRRVDACLIDCGASSMRFNDPDRGFALAVDGPLDMRMNQRYICTHVWGRNIARAPAVMVLFAELEGAFFGCGVTLGISLEGITAADVLNSLTEEELSGIFYKYGEERNSRKIARHLVDFRKSFGFIRTTRDLANAVAAASDMSRRSDKLGRSAHVATRVFQALRIFVNDELNQLDAGIESVYEMLRPGGRLAVLAFHSLEDRIAKRHFHGIAMSEKFNLSVSGQTHKDTIHEADNSSQLLYVLALKAVQSPSTFTNS